MRLSMDLSYGTFAAAVEGFARLVMAAAVGTMMAMSGPALAQTGDAKAATDAAKPIRLAVLGDSLTAGFGLAASDAFPAKLQKALRDKGIAVDVLYAACPAIHTAGLPARLVDPARPGGDRRARRQRRAARGRSGGGAQGARRIRPAQGRNVASAVADVRAAELRRRYVAKFNGIYPEAREGAGVPLIRFFLDGVATVANLTSPMACIDGRRAGVVVQRSCPPSRHF